MRFLPDDPITNFQEDKLGFSKFIESFKNSIYNTETPFVYGVLGDWGVGKTSILRLLQNKLKDDISNGIGSFVPIWFNAWQYENETNIIYPLLYAIKNDYENRLKTDNKHNEFWNSFKIATISSIALLTDLAFRIATKQLTGEKLKLEDVAKQINQVEEDYSQLDDLESILSGWADQVSQLYTAFETLLDSYADDMARISEGKLSDKDKICFVIIIDDLDRCLPETVITVLESIKNYLTVKKCVFVLGINPNVIYQGIRTKYQGLEIDGREYLEKILNYSFYVPEPEINKVSELVVQRFKNLVLDSETLKNYENNFTEFGKILEKCNFNNPRKIKRILNRYLFFLDNYEKNLDNYHNSNIVRLIILAEYFPSIFQLFIKDENLNIALKTDFKKIRSSDFDVDKIEKKYSIKLTKLYTQLSRMSELFNLNMDTTNDKFQTVKQAQDVFSITRLI